MKTETNENPIENPFSRTEENLIEHGVGRWYTLHDNALIIEVHDYNDGLNQVYFYGDIGDDAEVGADWDDLQGVYIYDRPTRRENLRLAFRENNREGYHGATTVWGKLFNMIDYI